MSNNTLNNLTTNKVSINELQNTLNELINRNDLSVKTTELSNELLETTKIIENCTSCNNEEIIDTYAYNLDKIKNYLAKLEKKEQGKKKEDTIDCLNNKLFKINNRLNKEILCEGCKEKEIEKLTDKCENEEIARFLYYQCKLNAYYCDSYIRWIPFDEFKNIEYLAKGDFGEVHKATWVGYDFGDEDVVLKRIYNNNSSDDNIVDILKEVSQKFITI